MKFDLEFIVFFVPFSLIFVFMVYMAISGGGIRAISYGKKICKKIGRIDSGERGLIRGGVIVDLLSGKNGLKKTGITVVAKSLLSYQMLSISLSKDETLQFIEHLKQTVNEI